MRPERSLRENCAIQTDLNLPFAKSASKFKIDESKEQVIETEDENHLLNDFFDDITNLQSAKEEFRYAKTAKVHTLMRDAKCSTEKRGGFEG